MTGLIISALRDTLVMILFSTAFAVLIGMPVGLILIVTRKGGISENPVLYALLDGVINVFRSIPFIILIIMLIPVSRFVVGTMIGIKASIVALTIGAAPFVARMIEQTLLEVDKGVIEAAKAMGSTKLELILKVMLPESMPALINTLTIIIINIVGYTAMAGAIGGGGLGEIAIRYGLYRGEYKVQYISVILIILIVQIVQIIGTKLSVSLNKK